MELGKTNPGLTTILAVVFFAISAFFVYRSFYGMRIRSEETGPHTPAGGGNSTGSTPQRELQAV